MPFIIRHLAKKKVEVKYKKRVTKKNSFMNREVELKK